MWQRKKYALVANAVTLVTLLLTGAQGCVLDRCPEGQLCLFSQGGYMGTRFTYALNNNDNQWGNDEFPGGFPVGNNVESVINNTGAWVGLYEYSSWGGFAVCLAPRVAVDYDNDALPPVPPELRNNQTSHQWGNASRAPQRDGTDCDHTFR